MATRKLAGKDDWATISKPTSYLYRSPKNEIKQGTESSFYGVAKAKMGPVMPPSSQPLTVEKDATPLPVQRYECEKHFGEVLIPISVTGKKHWNSISFQDAFDAVLPNGKTSYGQAEGLTFYTNVQHEGVEYLISLRISPMKLKVLGLTKDSTGQEVCQKLAEQA